MMSLYDVMQSTASIGSVFVGPVGTKMWAFGNDGTCSAQGFLHNVSRVLSYLAVPCSDRSPFFNKGEGFNCFDMMTFLINEYAYFILYLQCLTADVHLCPFLF
jgi:hypothetical protein